MKRCVNCEQAFSGASWKCPDCGWEPEIRDGFVSFVRDGAAAADSFEPGYFPALAALEAGHFWFRARTELIVSTFNECFPAARRVLDVGCGTGLVLSELHRRMPHLELVGADLFVEGLAFARTRLDGVPLYRADARAVPFEDEFDVVCSFDVVEHVDDDERALRELFRATRSGGGTIVTVPQHRWLWSPADDAGHHKRRYTRAELATKLRRAGFEVVRITSFVTLLLPVMVASRLRARHAGDAYDPRDELRVHHTINRLFERVLALERALIRRGARLPLGGSLLAVGTKR